MVEVGAIICQKEFKFNVRVKLAVFKFEISSTGFGNDLPANFTCD